MPNNNLPQERLARIEALLDRLIKDVEELSNDLAADKAELAAIKNKGAGVLIGVAVFASMIGAKFKAIVGAFGEVLK